MMITTANALQTQSGRNCQTALKNMRSGRNCVGRCMGGIHPDYAQNNTPKATKFNPRNCYNRIFSAYLLSLHTELKVVQ